MNINSLEFERVQSAAMEAQARQDATFAKSDPSYRANIYALPIILRGLSERAEAAEDMQALVDSSFSGRLRGYVITVLKQRHGIKLARRAGGGWVT